MDEVLRLMSEHVQTSSSLVAGNISNTYYTQDLGICLVRAQVEAINCYSHNKLISPVGFGLFAENK